VRVVLQRDSVGLNPKVNQLVNLARAARYDLVVVSDSNTRVGDGYLDEIAARFEDARVGLVTHPVAGVGEERLGALLDNLHLSASIGAGMIGAKRVVGQDVVVGKSMALRRRDLDALGGFAALGDVLAEDYILGRMVARQLGKRVVVARAAVYNVSQRRRVRDFFARYRRWSVIHRQAIGARVYACEILLNPTAIAALAAALQPSRVGAFAMVVACKLAYEAAAVSLLRGGRPPWRLFYATPLKDALLAAAWATGLVQREIDWRGNKLRVLAGTRLARPREFARNSQSRAAA
jgi:ceramide glucosyltransferase